MWNLKVYRAGVEVERQAADLFDAMDQKNDLLDEDDVDAVVVSRCFPAPGGEFRVGGDA
ncbi:MULTISPECIES: hypothetical protein [unclassified Haloferax]|uniref:hypothetical protein n=1 Tax=unclassified Haloferax TaxID=2625095 RepID=UPI00287616FD|nr:MULTISPECIES: hypothetical protein [unclassified Haloferax]MDS0243946.1 hypothetical protein [Haloferax sp. S2CR25]MDS0447067.1 hypothetical protein [Haloferax sp. S2CR25-2]